MPEEQKKPAEAIKPTIKKAAESKKIEPKVPLTPEPAKPIIAAVKVKTEAKIVSGEQATWVEIMNTSRGLKPDGSKR